MESLVKRIGLCVDSDPARLLAVFVVDANETTLTAPDHR